MFDEPARKDDEELEDVSFEVAQSVLTKRMKRLNCMCNKPLLEEMEVPIFTRAP